MLFPLVAEFARIQCLSAASFILSPAGKILKEIDVLGASPSNSNICCGPDGGPAYVTEVKGTRLVQFRVVRPGLAWKHWRD